MIDTIIIVIIIVLLWFALKKSIKHFKGEETCCNSKGDTTNKKN